MFEGISLKIDSTPFFEVKSRYLTEVSKDFLELIEEQSSTILWQKEQLEAIIENMSDALVIIDQNGIHAYFSKTLAGFPLGKGNIVKLDDIYKYYTFLDDNWEVMPRKTNPFSKILRGEKVSHMRMAAKHKGLVHYLNISGSPVYDKNGKFLMGILCVWDVTEQVKYQELLNAQRDVQIRIEKEKQEELEKVIKMKDEFLYTMSHEFKTPLTVINAALQAMDSLCRDELSGKVKGFLTKIKQNNMRQLRLVNNLLDITKVTAGQMRINKENHDIVFITKAITDSVRVFAQQKGVILTFKSKTAKRIIGIDEEKYERILLNLLSNAIKFSPKGSTILVKVESKRDYVDISVKDEGIGIPEEKQELIFERFGQVDSSLTRQAEGTGIGLSLVKLLVEAMGARISVKSKPGKGSTFRLSLSAVKIENEPCVYKKKNIEEMDSKLIHALEIEFSDIYMA